MTIRVAFVVAMARNRVIGRDNALPWRIPADLAHFKRLTVGKPVIMGRRTYESIGRPLPQRLNIVMSRAPTFHAEGIVHAATLDEALWLAEESRLGPEAMVIGGAQIYAMALPRTAVIHLTEVDLDPEGDAFFPELDPTHWRETSRDRHDGAPSYSFVTLERCRVGAESHAAFPPQDLSGG